MSKKAKKTTKKAAKKAVKAAPRRAAAPRALSQAAAPKRTSAATIFISDAGGATRVRTSPQLLTAAPGFVEWTVVNLTSGPMPDVEITWPAGGPWGHAAIPVRNGSARLSLNGARQGHFKYNVTCNGFTEDPELEWPEQ